jgi:hypothetical protein
VRLRAAHANHQLNQHVPLLLRLRLLLLRQAEAAAAQEAETAPEPLPVRADYLLDKNYATHISNGNVRDYMLQRAFRPE